MHERLKELAKQATYTAKGANGCVWGDNVSLEKFAELIIKECGTVGNRAENDERELRCMYNVITNHFGVEE